MFFETNSDAKVTKHSNIWGCIFFNFLKKLIYFFGCDCVFDEAPCIYGAYGTILLHASKVSLRISLTSLWVKYEDKVILPTILRSTSTCIEQNFSIRIISWCKVMEVGLPQRMSVRFLKELESFSPKMGPQLHWTAFILYRTGCTQFHIRELSSLNMISSVTYYLKSHHAISIYCISHFFWLNCLFGRYKTSMTWLGKQMTSIRKKYSIV